MRAYLRYKQGLLLWLTESKANLVLGGGKGPRGITQLMSAEASD